MIPEFYPLIFPLFMENEGQFCRHWGYSFDKRLRSSFKEFVFKQEEDNQEINK